MSTPLRVVDGIFRDHYAWLCRWLRLQAPAGHLPEDIASEAMLRITKVAARQVIEEPRAILTVIARRIVYDLHARGELHRAYTAAVAHLPEALAPSPEDELLILETLRRIEQALQPLSGNARAAFLLSHVDGMRHAEIAETLGVSTSMVRKYLATAMKACYWAVQDDEE